MQDLSRSVGKPHAPLFAPLLFGVSAQIESIAPEAMARDATRLRKNVGELRRVLGLDAVYCVAPGEAEARAIGPVGAEVSTETVARDENIAASLEAVRQWQADASAPVIVAALHGPMILLKKLRAAGCDASDEASLQHIGRGLAAIVRAFAEAGVHAVQLHDEAPGSEVLVELWKGALGTAGNVARFHRVPPLLVVGGATINGWPAQAIPCPTREQHAGALSRPHGRAWSAEPDQWSRLPGEAAAERIVTTVAEVRGDIEIGALLANVRRIRED
jgi:acetophenone carboxylase